jgi:putative methyltransferase
MKNIYLVQVVDAYGPNKFLPLAIAYQWLYARNDNWNLKDTLIEKIPPTDYVQTMDTPALVAMSSYVWNWEYNQALAIEIKKHWPDCVIVVGGPQIHKRDPEFFNRYPMFDLAVHGEGERAFREILARDSNYDGIPHVQTRTHMPKIASRVLDISDIPSPILEGFYEPIMAKYPKDTMWQVTFETLRGCPYHCAFCDIGDSYWNKLTLFDIDRVKAEIDWMGKNRIEYVSVCDSNWGLLERDREITQYVIDVKKQYGYPRWWDATWAKNNVDRNFEIAMMNKTSGADIFKGVTFAMQSFNDPTLEASERFNIKETEVRHYLQRYKQEGIPTYSELIWPMPEETYESLKTGIQKLIDLGQDSFLMIHPLVITNNATMGDPAYQKRWGIEVKTVPLDTYYLSTKDLKDYIVEYTDAVCSTNTVDYETVLEGHMFGWIAILMYYYGWGHYLTKYICKETGCKETDVFENMLKFIKANSNTCLHHEYQETLTHLKSTFEEQGFWGRRVLGDDDIYWEYKGASSVILHENSTKLLNELVAFMEQYYPSLPAFWPVFLNCLMCKNNTAQYPLSTKDIDPLDEDLAEKMLGIRSNNLIIDHSDRSPMDKKTFYHKAYHWNRKASYWRCTVSDGNKPIDINHK